MRPRGFAVLLCGLFGCNEARGDGSDDRVVADAADSADTPSTGTVDGSPSVGPLEEALSVIRGSVVLECECYWQEQGYSSIELCVDEQMRTLGTGALAPECMRSIVAMYGRNPWWECILNSQRDYSTCIGASACDQVDYDLCYDARQLEGQRCGGEAKFEDFELCLIAP